jgi:uncharacterized protein YjiS (DUF1127 family)
MTTLDRTTLPMTGTTRPALAVRLAQNVAAAFRAWKNRREIYHLGLMSESELADIGLTRADLHVAWREPFGIDPTVRLGRIAEARAAQELREASRVSAERAAREVC